MAPRKTIRFLLNDTIIETGDVQATATLLDYLRLERGLTGTKEGCNEGDCGACTVLVGRLGAKGLTYQGVNACIRFLASLDGCHIVTIEALAKGGTLHPVQQAMVDHHGSQCGFCTPGIVMSLYALWMEHPDPSETQIEQALQGNLCRCTGYEPIIKAAKAISGYGSLVDDALHTARTHITAQLEAWHDDRLVDVSTQSQTGSERFFIPQTTDQLATLLSDHPGATLVAGATDVGLWVNKDQRTISPAIFIGGMNDLQTIAVDEDAITVGGGVSYADFIPVMQSHFPHMDELWWRIGGAQVRAMGTLGGNIANGSPIGDSPPGFIALGATLTLRSASGTRSVPLEAFFLAYGSQDRRPDEFIESITIPRPQPGSLNAVYKLSKRRDEDISALCGAFSVSLSHGTVSAVRIAFGGMAGTPARAKHVEATLLGKRWNEASVTAAMAAFAKDYEPLSDWRASAAYRLKAAENLLMRFYLESTMPGAQVRLSREVAA